MTNNRKAARPLIATMQKNEGDMLLHCSPTLDRRKLDFSGFFTMTGW